MEIVRPTSACRPASLPDAFNRRRRHLPPAGSQLLKTASLPDRAAGLRRTGCRRGPTPAAADAARMDRPPAREAGLGAGAWAAPRRQLYRCCTVHRGRRGAHHHRHRRLRWALLQARNPAAIICAAGDCAVVTTYCRSVRTSACVPAGGFVPAVRD